MLDGGWARVGVRTGTVKAHSAGAAERESVRPGNDPRESQQATRIAANRECVLGQRDVAAENQRAGARENEKEILRSPQIAPLHGYVAINRVDAIGLVALDTTDRCRRATDGEGASSDHIIRRIAICKPHESDLKIRNVIRYGAAGDAVRKM